MKQQPQIRHKPEQRRRLIVIAHTATITFLIWAGGAILLAAATTKPHNVTGKALIMTAALILLWRVARTTIELIVITTKTMRIGLWAAINFGLALIIYATASLQLHHHATEAGLTGFWIMTGTAIAITTKAPLAANKTSEHANQHQPGKGFTH